MRAKILVHGYPGQEHGGKAGAEHDAGERKIYGREVSEIDDRLCVQFDDDLIGI